MNPIDTSELTKARDRLQNGGVVAIPTETVYGLAASIESEAGIRKIFALKERPFFDPLIVHVEGLKQAQSLVKEWPPLADFLARTFWPGALTLILPKAAHVSSLITSGLETVAIRQPSHPVARDLIHLLGRPIAAPSANKFGKTSPSCAAHVRSEFPHEDLLVIDGGPCEIGVESTVIGFAVAKRAGGDEDEVQIYRPGGVTQEMIEGALKKWSRPTRVRRLNSDASPGSLKHHYMPDLPFVIVPGDEPVGLSLTTRERIESALKRAPIRSAAELALDADPALAARELYGRLRELAAGQFDLIYVRQTSERSQGGLWQAVWDRLSRAASLDLGSQ